MNILLVHPDDDVREAVSSLLEKGGHRMSAAADGPRALAAYARRKPDLVIVNEALPSTASYQVFAEIRRIDPKAKVLLFALHGGADEERAPARFGVRGFRPSEVLDLIEKLQDGTGAPATLAGPPRRVLVADDDPAVRETLRRFLTEKGYEVSAASDGEDALARLKGFSPHLILLDIDMPAMDGVEALRRIRRRDDRAAVMMITGNDELETMSRCRDYGAYDYLIKPFDFQYLEFSVYSKLLLMTS